MGEMDRYPQFSEKWAGDKKVYQNPGQPRLKSPDMQNRMDAELTQSKPVDTHGWEQAKNTPMSQPQQCTHFP